MNELDPLARIRELCRERNWTCYQLAKASGISYSTLSTMLNKQNMPSLPTLQKLCSGFGISMSEFFAPAGSSPSLTEDQRRVLALYSLLPPEDRPLAVAYLKGLLRQV